MRHSLYWDDFENRCKETVEALKKGNMPDIRRVAIFITNKCNFRCRYCNMSFGNKEMSEKFFDNIVREYGNEAIIHVTGGEPSTVKWLYKYIDNSPAGLRFHLNTNAYIEPPINIRRLKVSLDTNNKDKFNTLVGNNAFDTVVKNIKKHSSKTVTSITCTLSKKTYKNAPEFMAWCRKTFPDMYAVFFSCYKGDNPEFVFSNKDVMHFFNDIKPRLEREMDKESLALFNETVDEKFRLIQGVRFPENDIIKPCYLSMSEKIFDFNEKEYHCSHLFRDNIFQKDSEKHEKCKYGCNRRLIMFNDKVEEGLS